MHSKPTKTALIAIYLSVFFIILFLTCLTPMLADDYSYCFSYANGQRIKNLSDILTSLKAHRIKMNGRLISHGLTMLFLMLPKTIFNVFNASNAVVLLLLFTRFLNQGNTSTQAWKEPILTILATLLIWVFMPVFGQVFLWLDGSLNYSWAMTAVLAFILPFYHEYRAEKIKRQKNKCFMLSFFVLSFVAGAYSENASCAGIFMALCFLVIIYLKHRSLPYYLVIAVVLSCFGFLFMMTAPAESGRAIQVDFIGIAKNIQHVIEATRETLLPLYCTFAFLITVAGLLKVNHAAIIVSFVFFLGSIVSISVFVFALYFPWRALCATTVFLILANVILLNELWNSRYLLLISAITSGFALYCTFSFALAVGDIGVLYMESKQREAVIISGIEDGVDPIMVHRYSSNTKYAASYLLPDLYEDSWEWPNYDIAEYFGAPAIVGLPPEEVFGTG